MKGIQVSFKEKNDFQFYRRIIEIYTCLNDIRLSNTETNILVRFCMDGISDETEQSCLREGIIKSPQHYRNIKTKLTKYKLIKKKSKNTYRVIESLLCEDSKLGIIVKIDNLDRKEIE